MRPFKYVRASDANAAARAVGANPNAKFLAGGTNILDLMKEDVERPNQLVDLGRLKLAEIKPEELPESLRPLEPAAQQAAIEEMVEKRSALLSAVGALSKDRAEYLRQKVQESGGARDSLDGQLYEAVREQAKDKGLRYEADAPAY